MLRLASKRVVMCLAHNHTINSARNFKVCVLGGAGGIGQPLSLLLKVHRLVTDLALYDIVKHTPGVGVDLSHINTEQSCVGYTGDEGIKKALTCSDIVMCAAGMPRKPGMSRDDLFKTNACIVVNSAEAVAKYCPKALFAIITNPVNTVIPMAAHVLKEKKVYDPKKLFGVTTLDWVRACTFIAEINGCEPKKVQIQIVGGHSPETIVPVVSQCKPKFKGDEDQSKKLIKRVQQAGTEVVKAKAGAGSATLSMAYAALTLCNSMMRGLKGDSNVIECCYVDSKVTEAPFFSTPLVLGKGGIEKNLGLPDLDCYEQELVDKAIPVLKKNIQKGLDFFK